MNPKILPAAVVSAALALGGCASLNPLTESSTPFDCRSNTCEVPVEYNNIGSIIAHDIQVNADPGTNVQITFVLNSWMHAHFPPDGITVSSNFRCALDGTATNRIVCKGTGLQRGARYKYNVRLLAGIVTPWPLDPFIRN